MPEAVSAGAGSVDNTGRNVNVVGNVTSTEQNDLSQHIDASQGSSWGDAAATGVGSSQNSLSLMGTGNTLTVTQESPQAISALLSTVTTTLATQAGVTQSAFDLANTINKKSLDIAEAGTATASQQGTDFMVKVGLVIVLGLGIWWAVKASNKGGK